MALVLGTDFRVLLAAVDLSEASVSVFDRALAIAHHSPKVTIHLVYVNRGKGSAASAAAVEALTRWAERLPEKGATVELHGVAHDDPATAIVHMAAKLDADAILIGTHGRTGLSRALVGSVAESVVRAAGCSVFVVREKVHGDSDRRQ